MAKKYPVAEEGPIDDITLLEPEATYSYADYLRWSFEERVELIKGKLFKMSPAPNRQHQKISGELFARVHLHLNPHKCEVYSAPFDVRLPKKGANNKQTYNVVQPDLCVCDESKLDDAGCIGAPDLIVEILSPSTASKDLKDKFELYEEHGVKEYWVVYPGEKVIEVFLQEKQARYGKPTKYTGADKVTSVVLAGFEVQVNELFVL